MRKLAITAAAVVLSVSACGSAPSANQTYLAGGWAGMTADDRLGLCAAWRISPKVTADAAAEKMSDRGVTASDAEKFLAKACR